MYIVFDIGGTKMRLAASEDGRKFGEPKVVPTPKQFEEGIAQFAALAHELARGGEIRMVAGGIAGPFNRERTELAGAPNLPGWNHRPLKHELEKAAGAPVILENDAAVAALGEATAGAGKGRSLVAYLTISTGVGGARIVNGKIDKAAVGFEPGHQIIDIDGSLCGGVCGGDGDLEQHVSGSALEKRYGKKAYEITDKKVWDQTARMLAYGLHNTIVHWSPEVIVLGGAMILGDPAIPLEGIRKYLKEILHIFPEVPEITRAALGDAAGLHGALALLHEKRKNETH
ncbi:MAG: ROK family protein [Candidatus Liptonbacteria bacterium]|nr:ROK family protein [Candidatus Liptonbacteria bacterium]